MKNFKNALKRSLINYQIGSISTLLDFLNHSGLEE
jgi:hypothetical protein